MTIKKTFYFDISHPDRSYDNLVPFKAETKAKAFQMAQEAYPEAYVHDNGRRRNERRAYWRGFSFLNKELTKGRCTKTGQFRFRHKGKKRRGMKNYPTPKRGWRQFHPLISFTWKEKYAPTMVDFLERWTEEIMKESGPLPVPASLPKESSCHSTTSITLNLTYLPTASS